MLAFQLGYVHVPASQCVADPHLSKQVHPPLDARPRGDPHPLGRAARCWWPSPVPTTMSPSGRPAGFGDRSSRHRGRGAAIEAAITRLEAGDQPNVVASETRTVALVETMLADAVRERASDIHIEPTAATHPYPAQAGRRPGAVQGTAVRHGAASIASRLKVMAKADIGERRRHQDGRILYETPRGNVDMRASFYVTIHGEKIVLRLLNNRDTLLKIDEINMAPRMLQQYLEDALDAPSGVIIITGPTGSGKTTTLYASVNHLNNARTSIITAEDPVEYVIDGIGQCSINSRINLGYEETLKHIVRQDPTSSSSARSATCSRRRRPSRRR